MKSIAYIWEHYEGSDDPRAIQGGGGPGAIYVETRTNSLWLIKAYCEALGSRYGETFTYSIIGESR